MNSENIYKFILEDSKNNEVSKFILEKIKNYSKKNADKDFKPGEITNIVLSDLKKILDNNSKNIKSDEWSILEKSILLEIMIKKYLKEEPIYEIGLKI
jgi:hypothetical protein